MAVWIGLNVAGITYFDIYPFILLNLALSLQAAYKTLGGGWEVRPTGTGESEAAETRGDDR